MLEPVSHTATEFTLSFTQTSVNLAVLDLSYSVVLAWRAVEKTVTQTCIRAGGDWGGMLSKTLGLFHSDHCIGIHVNRPIAEPQLYNPLHILQYVNAFAPVLDRFPVLLSNREIQDLKDSKHWQEHEFGKPRTCHTCHTTTYAMTHVRSHAFTYAITHAFVHAM